MQGMTHNTNPHTPAILVIGAHGKTGRRVAARLRALGRDVRAVSRSTTPGFDWNDESTWPAALDGVSAAYVTFQPDLAVPGASDTIASLGEAAVAHGLDHLVLLSGRGEPEAQACEDILLASGVDTTIVRCSFFAQNFSEHFLVDAVLDGVIALPAGDVREPIVDADDIADVVVSVLTEPDHENRVYELTGPQLLSFADVAAALSAATGREVTYQPVTRHEYAVRATAAGLPVADAEMLAALFAHIFDGHNEALGEGVSDVLGRHPRGFTEFATAAAASGAWTVGAPNGVEP
jgi:uncharacterized protein YbjT (DUF2867 family)